MDSAPQKKHYRLVSSMCIGGSVPSNFPYAVPQSEICAVHVTRGLLVSGLLPKNMGSQDWMRILLTLCLQVYLTYLIYNSITRLIRRPIGSMEEAKDASVLMMPSITICPTTMRDKSDRRAKNITADFGTLPKLKDWIEGIEFQAHVIINNRYIFQFS